MTDREAFISAIAANPADDAPRLVFADWLDEHGEGARAGFIRDQVQLAKLRPGSDEYRTLFRRTADTLRANLPAWIADVCEAFGQPTEWEPGRTSGGIFPVIFKQEANMTSRPGLGRLDFVRGFPDDAFVVTSQLSGPEPLVALFDKHPITRVTFGLPDSPQAWQRITSRSLSQVRNLALFGVASAEVLDAVYGDPVWKSLVRLSIRTMHSVIFDRLCASPLAKRLVALRATCCPAILNLLHLFPLDDRLQEFVFYPPDKFGSRPCLQPDTWSQLSVASFRPTLKRLDLTGCTVGDRGLATFARGDVWVRLRALVLDRNRFGDPGWRDFVRSHRTPELRLLSASRNFVTGDGAGRLGRSSLAATLEYVDLRGNRIDGKGAISLARSLAGGPLKKLLLAGNPIGPLDAAAVRQVLGLRVDVGG